MLLQHAWLAPLSKADTIGVIAEEDEEEEEMATAVPDSENATPTGSSTEITPDDTEIATLVVEEVKNETVVTLQPDVVDREVAEWVLGAIARRRSGKMGHAAPPALHKAPLDVVGTPEKAPVRPPSQTVDTAPV